jgi:hypothetical protein
MPGQDKRRELGDEQTWVICAASAPCRQLFHLAIFGVIRLLVTAHRICRSPYVRTYISPQVTEPSHAISRGHPGWPPAPRPSSTSGWPGPPATSPSQRTSSGGRSPAATPPISLPPHRVGSAGPGPLDQDRRWTDARQLLHDKAYPAADRVAGLLTAPRGGSEATAPLCRSLLLRSGAMPIHLGRDRGPTSTSRELAGQPQDRSGSSRSSTNKAYACSGSPRVGHRISLSMAKGGQMAVRRRQPVHFPPVQNGIDYLVSVVEHLVERMEALVHVT